MAITFASVSAAVEVASGNITLDTPADIRIDDFVVAALAYRGTPDYALPAGWTLIQHQPNGDDVAAGIANGISGYFIHSGTLPSFTFTRAVGGVARGVVAVYRGVDTTTPVDVSNSATAGAASTTVTSPSITTTVANTSCVLIGCAADDGLSSAQTAATSPTTGWVERHDSITGTGNDTSISIADAFRSGAAGSTGQFSMTNARSARHVGIGFALRPRATPIASLIIPPPAFRLMQTR